MAYDNPTRITHSVTLTTSTATATATTVIRGPKGMKGRLVEIGGVVTTAITTTAPKIAVGVLPQGTGTNDTTYGEFDLSKGSYGGSLPIPLLTAVAATFDDPQWKSRSTNTLKGKIPADSLVQVRNTTASAAGAIAANITIDWFF